MNTQTPEAEKRRKKIVEDNIKWITQFKKIGDCSDTFRNSIVRDPKNLKKKTEVSIKRV